MNPALRTRVLREWQPYGQWDAPARLAPALQQLVPGVMKRLGLEQRMQQSQIFHQWVSIVGADIARHAQPVSLKNGLLVVAVDNSAWLQELDRNFKPLILQKIWTCAGKGAVKKLVLRIG